MFAFGVILVSIQSECRENTDQNNYEHEHFHVVQWSLRNLLPSADLMKWKMKIYTICINLLKIWKARLTHNSASTYVFTFPCKQIYMFKFWIKNSGLSLICDVLRDLVPFAQFKKRQKHSYRSAMKLQASACNFSKVLILHGSFSRFLNSTNGIKLHKASQCSKLTMMPSEWRQLISFQCFYCKLHYSNSAHHSAFFFNRYLW